MTYLLICSKGGRKRNFHNYIFENFNIKELDTLIIEVENYPEPSEIIKLISKLNNFDFKKIYSIGGGSVIDISKVLSIFLPLNIEPKLSELEDYQNSIQINKKIDLVTIPTTCGTGAEVTQFATIWDQINNKKYSIDHPSMLPTDYLLDANLLKTLSYKNFLFPALDCISHTLESIWNVNRTDESLIYSKKSLDLLKNEVNNFDELNFSEVNYRKMLLASNYAGKAINITRTSIAHAISYKYTLDYSVPHGLACSFTLPKIHDYVKSSVNDEIYNQFIEPIDFIIEGLNKLDLNSLLKNYTNEDKVMFSDEEINLSRSTTFLQKATSTFINKIISI